MDLQDKLDAFKAQFESKAPKAALDTMHQATADLAASGQAERAVPLGSKLPPFALPNQNGDEVRLQDLLGKGPLVVSFFRGGWCPYCNIEIEALGNATQAIREAGAELVVITPQKPERSQAMRAEKRLEFDMLSDLGLKYAEQLGLAFPLPTGVIELYKSFKLDLPGYNGDDTWRLPMPTRLVLDANGVIVERNVEADYTRRPDPAQTIDAIKRLNAA